MSLVSPFFGTRCTCIFVFLCKRTIDVPEHLRNAELKDLKVITTIGVGGFGRVELVGHVFIILVCMCYG